jgi:hypothetical protein
MYILNNRENKLKPLHHRGAPICSIKKKKRKSSLQLSNDNKTDGKIHGSQWLSAALFTVPDVLHAN